MLSLPPLMPGVVETGIFLQDNTVETKLGRMKAAWALHVRWEIHSVFHCGQQCQAFSSSWLITVFRQQSRNFLFPLKYLAESLLLSKMLLKPCVNPSVLNQIPVWVVLFLSNLQIGGLGLVSCYNSAAARQLLENTRHHPKRYYLLYSGGLFSTMLFLCGEKWHRLLCDYQSVMGWVWYMKMVSWTTSI